MNQQIALMKWLILLGGLLLSFAAKADCVDEIFSYNDEKVMISMGFSDGCYQGELELTYSFLNLNKTVDDSASQYNVVSFQQECPMQKRNGEFIEEFSCRADGESPLAGGHYKVERYADMMECDGEQYPVDKARYVCIAGCTTNTPKQLILPNSGGTC